MTLETVLTAAKCRSIRSSAIMRECRLACCVIALASASAAVGGPHCTKAQALAAETEAGSLKSWAAVHESFRRYSHCDDGAIGEGYSESVTLLLADRWSSLPSLAKLMADDPPFETFVIRHIDDTVPKDRLAQIAANARQRCPNEHRKLCQRIMQGTHDG